MRLVIQRVLEASVSVQGNQVSKIGKGFLVLLGITHEDDQTVVEKYVNELLHLKAWPKIQTKSNQGNEEEKANNHSHSHSNININSPLEFESNIMENDYEVIVVSQFTLYGKMKGAKPDFHSSLNHEEANLLYENFVNLLKKSYKEDKVQTGKFRNRMAVNIVNDGPVTLIIDSAKE